MDEFEIPTPPPLPPGPVPMDWDYGSADGLQRERHHRLAVLHSACPRCADPPDELTAQGLLHELAQVHPFEAEQVHRAVCVTPEGELGSFVHGHLRVDDPSTFRTWASQNFVPVGSAFAHIVDVKGSPWTRALFWFAEDVDGRLHLEASNLDRYLHLEFLFEHLWPPVFRGLRISSPLDDRLDEPFRPLYPRPPAEASAFTRLRRVSSSAASDTPRGVTKDAES